MMARVTYRIRQFMKAAAAHPDGDAKALARERLSAAELLLFSEMHPSEQVHASQVLQTVAERWSQPGPVPAALQTAALLHDVGKSRYPLLLWQRVLIVLGRALLPSQVEIWSQRPPVGWAKPFVVAAHHPTWGAEMAAEAGSHADAVALIGAHQGSPGAAWSVDLSDWLALLRQADDDN
jgi:hypothetical protein